MSREHKQFRALLASYVEAVAAWRRAEDEGGAIISSWTNIANRLPLIEAAAADPRVRDARVSVCTPATLGPALKGGV